MATVVGICTLLRAFGFAATAVGRNLNGAVPFMYAVPLIGIAFGIYATTRGQRLRVPAFVLSAWDLLAALLRRAAGRNLALASVTTGDAP
jgi:hypothetical protein